MARLRLAGKTALVTGAMRGIGFETAKALWERGANVVLVDVDAEGVADAATRIGTERTLAIGADVTDAAAMVRVTEEAVDRFGALHVVDANAGVAPPPSSVRAMSPEVFDRVLEVNLGGVVNTVRATLPQVTANRGQYLLTASIYAFSNGVLQTPYAMSKAAVEQLGRSIRVELAPFGASVTVAYFGFVDTKMVADAFATPLLQEVEAAIPSGLRKQISAAEAAAGVVRAIERRADHVLLPRRWEPLRYGRGVIGPISDAVMRRHPRLQKALRTENASAA